MSLPRQSVRHARRVAAGDIVPRAVARILALLVVVATTAATPAADPPRATRLVPSSDPAELVRLLGSNEYAIRRRAESELVRLGIDAFDALKAAESDPDPEIASRANYLSHLIRIDWVQPEDPVEIRRILNEYGDLPEEDRLKQIHTLGTMTGDAALEALSRIVRFDASAELSKHAAITMLQSWPDRKSDRQRWREMVLPCLGRSQRTAARWLRAEAASLEDPRGAVDQWQQLIDQEQATIADGHSASPPQFLLVLLRRQVRLLKALDRTDEALAAMRMMVDLVPVETAGLHQLLDWLIDEQAWPVIEALHARFADRLRAEPILTYMMAQALRAQGKRDRAEALANEAFRRTEPDPEKHLESALNLEQRGLKDWAEREYRHVIDMGPAGAQNALFAGIRLSSMLHDGRRHLEAARLLEQTFQAVDRVAQRNAKRGSQQERGSRQSSWNMLRARMELYFALHYKQQQDWEQQREHLDRAMAYDPTEPDVLITMYHAPQAGQAYRARTRRLIANAVATFRKAIEEDPTDHDPYNQLAWLVSNTEGDVDEALRLSRKSLELFPGSAGYLDTLAHCYYAKGHLAKAVQVQRRAARLEPHTQVIARKLALFERKLAESAGTSSSEELP